MLVIKDFATTTLASALTAVATTITVSDGGRLPVLASGDHFYLVLQDFYDRNYVEIVKVVGTSGNVLTVLRGQDGTAARAFSVGAYVELRLTVRGFSEFISQIGTGGVSWSVVTTSVTSQSGRGYLVNSAGLTVTLPASPLPGQVVGIGDYNGKNYAVTIARNGRNIMGKAEDYVFSLKNANFVFVFIDSTVGWMMTQGFGEGALTQAIRNISRFTDVAGQASFSFPSESSGSVDVYYNGDKLDRTTEYVVSPTAVTLSVSVLASDDIIEIIGWNQAFVLDAHAIAYDSTSTGLPAGTMQSAIDSLHRAVTAQSGSLLSSSGWPSIPSYSDELIGDVLNSQARALMARVEQIRADGSFYVSSFGSVPSYLLVDGVRLEYGGDLFVVSSSIPNGGVVSPDCVSIGGGKYAVLKQRRAVRSGIYRTHAGLKHRCGQLSYIKRPGGYAELLTPLDRYKAKTDPSLVAGTVYVDWRRADNSGDGLSWATAKKSIGAGMLLNPDILLVMSGLYSRANRLQSFAVTKDVSICSVGGPVIQGSTVAGTWAKAGGYNNVYSLTYEAGLTNTTSSVFDTFVLNTENAPSAYVSKLSIAEVDATPGSFYHSGTVTHVHAIDSRDLVVSGDSLRVLQPVAGPLISYGGNFKVYMRGIECWYAGSGDSDCVRVQSNGTQWPQSVFFNEQCIFGGAGTGVGGNGLAVRDIGLAVSVDSGAVSNRRDGFNYHHGSGGSGGGGTSLSPHYLEIRCHANGNGVGGVEGNNQGSTAHEACVGFRIQGDYSGHKDGGNIVDIDASKCHLVNVSCNNSAVVGALLSADAWAGAPGVTAEWWIDGMWLAGNPAVANAKGDLAMDGYNSRVHYVDVISEKPVSTRSFNTPPDSVL